MDIYYNIYKTTKADIQKIFNNEKSQLNKDLENRVQKVISLEVKLDEEIDKRITLENDMSQGEKVLKKKVNNLQ